MRVFKGLEPSLRGTVAAWILIELLIRLTQGAMVNLVCQHLPGRVLSEVPLRASVMLVSSNL